MTILSYQTILSRLEEIVPRGTERNLALVNPASLDIRLGQNVIMEGRNGGTATLSMDQCEVDGIPGRLLIHPGQFFLVETLEWLECPVDLAFDLRLKSSRAREGFNHSLAFWVDPGWAGRLTMEITNITEHRPLLLEYGKPFAQIVFYRLDEPCTKPYQGKYKGDHKVSGSKS